MMKAGHRTNKTRSRREKKVDFFLSSFVQTFLSVCRCLPSSHRTGVLNLICDIHREQKPSDLWFVDSLVGIHYSQDASVCLCLPHCALTCVTPTHWQEQKIDWQLHWEVMKMHPTAEEFSVSLSNAAETRVLPRKREDLQTENKHRHERPTRD